MKKLVLLVVVVTAIMMLFTASVVAGPGNGAGIFHENYKYDIVKPWECVNLGSVFYCEEIFWRTGHLNTHEVITPSGNSKFSLHDRGEVSMHFGYYADALGENPIFENSRTAEYSYLDQFHYKSGDLHVLHVTQRVIDEDDYVTCDVAIVFTEVDGRMRAEKFDVVCMPK